MGLVVATRLDAACLPQTVAEPCDDVRRGNDCRLGIAIGERRSIAEGGVAFDDVCRHAKLVEVLDGETRMAKARAVAAESGRGSGREVSKPERVEHSRGFSGGVEGVGGEMSDYRPFLSRGRMGRRKIATDQRDCAGQRAAGGRTERREHLERVADHDDDAKVFDGVAPKRQGGERRGVAPCPGRMTRHRGDALGCQRSQRVDRGRRFPTEGGPWERIPASAEPGKQPLVDGGQARGRTAASCGTSVREDDAPFMEQAGDECHASAGHSGDRDRHRCPVVGWRKEAKCAEEYACVPYFPGRESQFSAGKRQVWGSGLPMPLTQSRSGSFPDPRRR